MSTPNSPANSWITRRRLLQAGLAGMVAMPACQMVRTRMAQSNARGRILVVGGGSAGLNIAARLHRGLAHPEITVLDPAAVHYYQPGFTMIAAGEFEPESVVRAEGALIPSGVKWVQDEAVAFEPERNRVVTRNTGSLDYDFLVLAPGLEMHFEGIEGVRRDRLGEGNVHCIYDYQGAIRCRDAIRRLSETGGRALFTDTWTKLKCGGAPKKVNLIAEDYCRRAGTRGKVDFQFISAGHHLFEVPLFKDRLDKIYAERGIGITWNHRIRSVDIGAKTVTFEKQDGEKKEMVTHRFDFLHVVPPMTAPGAVRNSPLAVNPANGKGEDWVPADAKTLVHARYKNVCVAGDVAGIPTSKTGAAIRSQAPVVARNLIALMENRPPDAVYDGYTACPFVTEKGKVLMAEFGYDKKPKPSIPWVDPGKEHTPGWILKRYLLKPAYFELMLRGMA